MTNFLGKDNYAGKVELVDANGTTLDSTNGVSIQASDSFSIDAFGRLRTSDTGQRFDVEFIYDKQPLMIDEYTSDSVAATFNSDTRDVTLAIGGTENSGKSHLVQHWYNPYTPGNSQLIDMTATLDSSDIGSGTASVFIKNNGTETEYTQENWNTNTVDDVDWSKSQIFQMDFQSLKVGRIRFGLVRDGISVKVHEIVNDNIRTHGYWQSATLPIYWKIYNDADNTYMEVGYGDDSNGIGFRYTIDKNDSATMEAICGTVKSEGGRNLYEMDGYRFNIGNTSAKTVSSTLIPILSIRPKATFNSVDNHFPIIAESYNIYLSNTIRYVILLNPTLTGASFVDVNTNYSGVQYDVSASAVSGGIQVDGGVISSGLFSGNTKEDLLGREILAINNFTDAPDILTIAAISLSGSSTVYSSMSWREIR